MVDHCIVAASLFLMPEQRVCNVVSPYSTAISPWTSLSAAMQRHHWFQRTHRRLFERASSSWQFPRAAVAVTIQSKKESVDHYLLVQRANPPDQGSWSLPGGKINLGESALAAAKRELTEETQLEAPILQWHPHPFMTTDAIVHDQSHFSVKPTHQDKNEDRRDSLPVAEPMTSIAFHYVIAQCFVRISDGLPPPIPSDDALDAQWCTLDRIRQLDNQQRLSPGVAQVVERAEELQAKGALVLQGEK